MAFRPLSELIDPAPVERPAPHGVVARELRFVEKGALVGFVTLEIPGWRLVFKGCRWFRKDGREWVSLPSERYEKDGAVKWRDLVEFTDKEAAARFRAAALAAVHAIAEGRE